MCSHFLVHTYGVRLLNTLIFYNAYLIQILFLAISYSYFMMELTSASYIVFTFEIFTEHLKRNTIDKLIIASVNPKCCWQSGVATLIVLKLVSSNAKRALSRSTERVVGLYGVVWNVLLIMVAFRAIFLTNFARNFVSDILSKSNRLVILYLT